MALYHLSLRKISRSRGSATHAIAYITGSKLEDSYDGMCYDHRSKLYVDETMIILPDNASEEWHDLQTLTNAINDSSNQAEAILAREIEFALPLELSKEQQREIALKFIHNNFVDDGMVAIVAFHSPKKKTADIMSYNPHVHVIVTAKPIDDEGNWISKSQRLYICENQFGEQKLLLPEEVKNNKAFEKIFHYRSIDGIDSWHTKSYANLHSDECAELVNRYPKVTKLRHPLAEKWADPRTLEVWRESWANIQNEAFDSLGIKAHVSHLSYAKQGLDLIPTIHEGKQITALERRLENGEMYNIEHTDIRGLNIAIKEHNKELKIIADLKKLQIQMKELIRPVVERLEQFGNSIAEKLERIRAELIVTSSRLKKSVEIKGKADEQIIAEQQYINELAPIRKEKLEELQQQLESLKKQYAGMTGLFQGKKKEKLAERIESLQNELNLYKENCKYALQAQKEIDGLKVTSEKVGHLIVELKTVHDSKIEEYRSLESTISGEDTPTVKQERLSLRPGIEKEMETDVSQSEFRFEADKIDKKLGCTYEELSGEYGLKMEPMVKRTFIHRAN